ncbi:hypothetical protein BJY01DRAFT_242163 [Aspergillus pseudoustus]|uniref:Mid2 domain-containing protein n=1 Tax=Aspergillus pseudoustus TaxID=1810923 RepID=A0ABR4KZW1_9EURO
MTNSMSDASTLGWALRQNGSCLAHEEDCGETVDPYRVCCPGGSYCPRAYNIVCCPSSLNCTEALQARPVCANQTWDLYYNGGYFCCEHGTKGYATSVDSNGCGEPEYELADSEMALSVIALGTKTSRSQTASTPTPTSTSTESETETELPESETGSSSPGTIAGAVIGGVAGVALIVAVIWLLFRVRRQRQQLERMAIPAPEIPQKEYPADLQVESIAASNGHRPIELSGGNHQGAAELPGNYAR